VDRELRTTDNNDAGTQSVKNGIDVVKQDLFVDFNKNGGFEIFN